MATGADLVAALEAEFGQPDPTDWERHYTPEEVAPLRAELADLEEQLDVWWPAWRDREPFHRESRAKVEGIKLRLKRRDLILHGKADHGVALVTRPRDQMPMAVPVRPSRRAKDRTAYRPIVTVTLLSTRLGMPVEQVEELLARLPAGVRDVRSWLAGERERGVAPPGSATAPLPGQPSAARKGKGAA